MRLNLPVISNAADYSLHFNDDVWPQAAKTICARHGLRHTAIRRSPQGENIIFLIDESLVIKIFAPFRENYLRETTALAFARGKLSIRTPDLLHTGEIESWPYLVMTQLEGHASRAVWEGVGRANALRLFPVWASQ